MSTISSQVSTAPLGILSIQPNFNSGGSFFIENFYFNGPCQIAKTDGTHTSIIYSSASSGSWTGANLHATNAVYITMENLGSSSEIFGYDGLYFTF